MQAHYEDPEIQKANFEISEPATGLLLRLASGPQRGGLTEIAETAMAQRESGL